MAALSAINSSIYQTQLYGQLAKSTMAVKNSAQADQALAQVIETSSKMAQTAQGTAAKTGSVDIYA